VEILHRSVMLSERTGLSMRAGQIRLTLNAMLDGKIADGDDHDARYFAMRT
jgi:hypothetical protein